MKTNTFAKYIVLLLLPAIALLAGCEKEGDKIYLSGMQEGELIASESSVILSQDNAGSIMLSLTWTKSELAVSNPEMYAPDLITTLIQASADEGFSGAIQEYAESGLSRAFTGGELNTLAKNLNLTPNVEVPVYFRIKYSIGSNLDPLYSNVKTVAIASFTIDMSKGFILDSKMEDTGGLLLSPASDGVYTGFMGASGWYNFFLREGDATTWGNDGAVGTPFLLSSEENADLRWNCWFPGVTGCYYVIVDTNKKSWSALLIPALTVSGGINGEMTFDRPSLRWSYLFSASEAATLAIKLSGTGKQYNINTGTDDAAAIDTPVAFMENGGKLQLTEQPADISLNIPAAGDYTLTVDLSDPYNPACILVSGSQEPQETAPFVYLPGVDDGISGAWTFDNTLALYYEDELSYAGVVHVNSLWGYSINTEKDNWDDKYTLAEGDAYAGTLVHKGETNLPAPEPGLYLFEVSIKALSYALIPVGEQIFLSGLNDVWDFSVSLLATDSPGIYEGEIVISQASEWGFTIHLGDGDWDHKYGGSNGTLYYRGSNITDDAGLEPGSYIMTVDLINATYNISAQ